MPTKARIAVIGTGWWSTYSHIPALQANPDAELVAVCDRDPEKLQAAARAYNIEQTYEDYRAMIEQTRPDGVVVATPHATHYAITKTCLLQSLHVMLEKPMTLYASEARELVDLARTREREVIIGYTNNYSSHARRAREVMQSGVLGPVQYVNGVMISRVVEFLRGDSHPDFGRTVFPVHGPGAVYSEPSLSGGGQGHLQITHLAGLLFFVTGLRARRVLGLMHNHGLAVDLVDVMAVEFEGGALGTVGGSGNAYQGKLDLQIHCERGSIDMDLAAGTTTIRGEDGLHEELERQSEADRVAGRFATINNLVDVVLRKASNGAPGEVGWRAVELLDAAYRSAANGGAPVTIESLYG
ncbi:MAG TPA: Gfo/Idh/MocA family oxidoreductase [Herpetosiphonaceae bacterium]|nr:Gfo/Idh/MocA family oxidoreductase [Herpetosiphonaceae bacterium]